MPYPRLHYLLPSFAPFVAADRAKIERMGANRVTSEVFCKDNLMAGVK